MNIRVLLVEDDKIDQMAFQRMVQIEELPYDTTLAASVEEAKQALQEKSFDIVMADYRLPDGTAFEVLNLINDCPFILLTGQGSEGVAVTAVRAGAASYLIKEPNQSHLEQLPSLVAAAIDQYRSRRRLGLYSAALLRAQAAMALINASGEISFINQQFIELTGFGEHDLMGETLSQLVSSTPEGTPPPLMDGSSTLILRRKNGTLFPATMTIRLLNPKKASTSSRIVTLMDHTLAEKKDKAMGRFVDICLRLLAVAQDPGADTREILSRLEEQLLAYKKQLDAGESGKPNLQVLLVEDDAFDELVTKKYLQRGTSNAQVHVVRDGESALDFLFRRNKFRGASRPDLVLLDMGLPKIEGSEVLKKMKEDPDLKTIPVIVLTGRALEGAKPKEIKGKPFDLMNNCYVNKWVDMTQFMTIIKAVEDHRTASSWQ